MDHSAEDPDSRLDQTYVRLKRISVQQLEQQDPVTTAMIKNHVKSEYLSGYDLVLQVPYYRKQQWDRWHWTVSDYADLIRANVILELEQQQKQTDQLKHKSNMVSALEILLWSIGLLYMIVTLPTQLSIVSIATILLLALTFAN